jgi:hypothetical protein
MEKRIVKIEAHVLAYLGDYLSAFKAVVKKTAESTLREGATNIPPPPPQARSPVGRS